MMARDVNKGSVEEVMKALSPLWGRVGKEPRHTVVPDHWTVA